MATDSARFPTARAARPMRLESRVSTAWLRVTYTTYKLVVHLRAVLTGYVRAVHTSGVSRSSVHRLIRQLPVPWFAMFSPTEGR